MCWCYVMWLTDVTLNTCSCQGGYDNLEVYFACQVVGTCASTGTETFLVIMNQF